MPRGEIVSHLTRMVTMPALDGVEHHYIELGDGVRIHVADAGPATGPAGRPARTA